MKRYTITIMIITLFLVSCCASCSKSSVDDDDNSQEIVTSTSESNVTTSEQQIFEGMPLEAKEIRLPNDGERITYSPAFTIFTDEESGRSLTAIYAERNGETITFYTTETEYFFDPLGVTIATSAGEIFISMNGIKQDDGTYKYDILLYEYTSDDDPVKNTLSEIKAYLGEAYEEEKNYYYVSCFFVYDSEK